MKKPTARFKVGSSSDPQQVSLSARFGAKPNDGNRDKFEWTIANPMLVTEAIAKCVGGGDAIMFGITRDGGCGVVSVLSGDERKRWYPANSESADQALMQISYAYATPEERREFPSTFVPMGGNR